MDFMKQMMDQQQQLIKSLTYKFNTTTLNGQSTYQSQYTNSDLLVTALKNVNVFHYAPDADVTFESWYDRFGKVFEEDAKHVDDASRVRPFIGKLGGPEQ